MGYRDYAVAKAHIVDTLGHGDFTTIQAAVTAATSGQTVFVMPGTYTENITHKDGVNITCNVGDGIEGNVIINGNVTCTGAGTFNISNVQLRTNSANCLTVSGSSATVVNLEGVYINCLNNTGISYTTSNSSAHVNIYNSLSDIGTTGISLFVNSSTGFLTIYNLVGNNSGSSTTASTTSAGQVDIRASTISFPISTSSTAILGIAHTIIFNSATNTTCITTAGTGTANVSNSRIQSGTASAISIGSGTSLSIGSTVVSSSNTNAITGAGTIVNSGICFIDTSSLINTTTQTARNFDVGGISFDGGTNVLSTYTDWTSWTPTVTGSGTAGTTTYTVQVGTYTRIGNIVFANLSVNYSAATGTGNMVIGGLPFTVNSTGAFDSCVRVQGAAYTFPVGVTWGTAQPVGATVTANVIGAGTALGATNYTIQNTATALKGTIIYRV